MLPQALPLSACAGPTAHLPKRSMRLPCAKPPTAAQSSHHATHNLPELTTRTGELTKRYTKQVQTSTSHTKWNSNKYTSLSHQEPACKCSSNGISERSSTSLIKIPRRPSIGSPVHALKLSHILSRSGLTAWPRRGCVIINPLQFFPLHSQPVGSRPAALLLWSVSARTAVPRAPCAR